VFNTLGAFELKRRDRRDNCLIKYCVGFAFIFGLNGVVISIADCYPKSAGFDSRVGMEDGSETFSRNEV
jgi:hypothetical protein